MTDILNPPKPAPTTIGSFDMTDNDKAFIKNVAGYATLIDYPEAWDVMAYPTLESAVRETLAFRGSDAAMKSIIESQLQRIAELETALSGKSQFYCQCGGVKNGN